MHSAKMYGQWARSCRGVIIYKDDGEWRFYNAQDGMRFVGAMPKEFPIKMMQLSIWMIAKGWIR